MPLLVPPAYTPLLADPTFLSPDQTPDNKWHLWAHTIFGITHYISVDGIQWKKNKIVVRSAMRPFIFKEKERYYLFYEKYPGIKLIFSSITRSKWYSQIEMCSSDDLKNWSRPNIVLKPELNFHQGENLGKSISNPCLIKINERYRLYYSASLVRIPDCGFNEPLHISFAESDRIDGNFQFYSNPIISPEYNNEWCNLGAGSIKVIICEDGFVAFQNGIYEHNGVSGSAIALLHSEDGIIWKYLLKEPILKPDKNISWMASHIYACDVKLYQGKLYLFFNARNHAHWSKGSEKIGLAIAVMQNG
jgi:beta-xylosidase